MDGSKDGLENKLFEPWNYDHAIRATQERILEVQEGLKSTIEVKKRLDKLLRPKKIKFMESSALRSLRDQNKKVTWNVEGLSRDVNYHQRILLALTYARPILVGPATVDSLFNRKPDSFEYIKEGKLPFDNLFFDFASPVKVRVPFQPVDSYLHAVLLEKGGHSFSPYSFSIGSGLKTDRETSPLWEYSLRSYMSENGDRGSNLKDGINMLFGDPGDSKGFRMYGKVNFSNGDEYHVRIDPNSKFARIITFKFKEHMPVDFQDIDIFRKLEKGECDEERLIEEGNDDYLLGVLPNFCVNMVNYINAHNVTLRQRTRGGYIPYLEANLPSIPPQKRPFYLVTIKDENIDGEEERQARSWELQWRLYIRGHDRRLRDQKGNIYMTTWVRPHIRGPPNAPWREQRYEVLAKKLEEEQGMYSTV